MTRIAVVTADGARELDVRTIAALPESYALMRRAAAAATDWLLARPERSAAVYVGPGNNGGDGWLIAGMLRGAGWSVSVHVAADPKTADAARSRADAERDGPFAPPTGSEALVLDALLGTGATGALRGTIAEAVAQVRAARERGATLIAIDIASGLDATDGTAHGVVPAHHTITFGSVKLGQLLRRDLTGALHVLDIGLVDAPSGTAHLVTESEVSSWLPTLAPDAYKGTRGRVAIVGGDAGMAGAAILAARGAHASGAGMVRADVAAASLNAVQVGVPFATARAWRARDWRVIDVEWPDAMIIGPGLDGDAWFVRDAVLELLDRYRGPVLLDAGALTAFRWRESRPIELGGDDVDAGDADQVPLLQRALDGRPALLTPHAGEYARLLDPDAQPTMPGDRASQLARSTGATVLLKGVPTWIADPVGDRLVSATGNPALAMGGSGDLLSGIAATLLAQGVTPLRAGAAAAFVHGTAAEVACEHHGGWRGVTMELLLHELSLAWPRLDAHVARAPHVVHELPAVPTR